MTERGKEKRNKKDLGKCENLCLIHEYDLVINLLLLGGYQEEVLAEFQAIGHASAVDAVLGCQQKSRSNNLHFTFVF